MTGADLTNSLDSNAGGAKDPLRNRSGYESLAQRKALRMAQCRSQQSDQRGKILRANHERMPIARAALRLAAQGAMQRKLPRRPSDAKSRLERRRLSTPELINSRAALSQLKSARYVETGQQATKSSQRTHFRNSAQGGLVSQMGEGPPQPARLTPGSTPKPAPTP